MANHTIWKNFLKVNLKVYGKFKAKKQKSKKADEASTNHGFPLMFSPKDRMKFMKRSKNA